MAAGLLLPAEKAAPPVTEPRGRVVLPSGRVLEVELADNPLKRERGYMFRENISDTEGMVFFMDRLGFHAFWMKNCRTSLDIVWLDESWKVVHLERNLPPCRPDQDPCPSYVPLQASLYVLEVQAGLTSREKLRIGDHIRYNAPPAGGR